MIDKTPFSFNMLDKLFSDFERTVNFNLKLEIYSNFRETPLIELRFIY